MSQGQADFPEDAYLVRRVLGGHREDYGLLVGRYERGLFRYAFGMVQDADAAADIVQDSFVKSFTALASCREPEKYGSWVFRIVRNRCTDYLKANFRREVPLREELDIGGAGDESERGVLRRELSEIMAAALSRLPASHREAFLLKHVEDLSYEEISAMLDVGISALKMRVARSRDALREALREAGYPSGSGM